MKIFVAGATGAVGLPLVRALRTLGHQATGVTTQWVPYCVSLSDLQATRAIERSVSTQITRCRAQFLHAIDNKCSKATVGE
ncbi:hypothetical protein CEJ86_31890 [Sinorhizobium meliloti]|uniref:Uncharacterized protein n=1 Tax=Rhizobium meliloti TaxID=382 RepID=A0A2J0YTC2_RHIML|nr:hypothetical protein CEJ86_31890 [Sinorhizobium meliloti]